MARVESATLITKFVSDDRQMHQSMKKLDNRADSLKRKFASLGKGIAIAGGVAAAGFSAVLKVVNNTANEVDRLGKVSNKLGVLPKELQFIQFRARLAGVGIEKLNMGLQRMSRRIGEAAAGTGEAKKALKELGLNAQNLANLGAGQQFSAIINALGQVENKTDRLRLGFKLFDSEAVDIVNTIGQNVRGLRREFESFGVGLTTKQVKAVERYNDSWTKLTAVLGSFSMQLTAELAPELEKFVNKFSSSIKEMGGLKSIAQDVADVMVTAFRLIAKGAQATAAAIRNSKNLAKGLPDIGGDVLKSNKNRSGLIGDSARAFQGLQQGQSIGQTLGNTQPNIPIPQSFADRLMGAAEKLFQAGDKLNTSGQVLQSSIPSIAPLLSKQKSSGLRQSISNLGGSVQSEIDRLVQGSSLNKPQFKSSEFDRLFRNVLERSQNARPGDQASINALHQTLDRARQELLVGQGQGFSTKAQMGALEQLREMIKGDIGDRKGSLKIELVTEEGLVVKHIKGKAGTKHIEWVQEQALENAAQTVS